MTTEKKKAEYLFFSQGKDRTLIAGAVRRKSGNGWCVKIKGEWYDFYLPKPKVQTEEEGA